MLCVLDPRCLQSWTLQLSLSKAGCMYGWEPKKRITDPGYPTTLKCRRRCCKEAKASSLGHGTAKAWYGIPMRRPFKRQTSRFNMRFIYPHFIRKFVAATHEPRQPQISVLARSFSALDGRTKTKFNMGESRVEISSRLGSSQSCSRELKQAGTGANSRKVMRSWRADDRLESPQ